MKITTTLGKIADKEFGPTLRRVMEKWSEARDVLAFVKIANVIDSEIKDWLSAMAAMTVKIGYSFDGGPKMSNAEEITEMLLQRFGHLDEAGRLSILKSTQKEKDDFLREKSKADAALKMFSTEQQAILEAFVDIEIPRQVAVTDKQFRKGVITALDCYVLEPILDLSAVSEGEDSKKPQTED